MIPSLEIYMYTLGICSGRDTSWVSPLMGTGAPVLRRGPYKTSQVGPFCLAASFLCLQQECSLRNLAPVAWHLVKLIHRQETNCQIKWVSSSLPLPSRFACGWDSTAFLPLLSFALFPPCQRQALWAFMSSHKRGRISTSCVLFINHLLDNQLKMLRTISFHVIPLDMH